MGINKFFSIPLNWDISAEKLNITDKQRTSRFSWTGQFSPQFIETMIRTYSNEMDTIFDPFSGSGTVLSEAIFNNRFAVGVELNPAAFYMSDYYRIMTLSIANKQNVIERVQNCIMEVISESSLKLAFEKSDNDVSSIIGLIITLLNFDKYEFDRVRFEDIWNQIKFELLTTEFKTTVQTHLGDTRKIKIDKYLADVTLTSPPYINVLNYHQQYRKSMEFIDMDVLGIAKNEVGSNRKNRGNRFLSVEDYVFDMMNIIRKTISVTKKGGRVIFVVGRESTVLGQKFYNGEIIYDIFMLLNQKFLARQERVFVNRFGKRIVEDIIHFEADDSKLPVEHLLDDGIVRLVKGVLVERIDKVDFEKKFLINNAIQRVEKRLQK